MNSVTYKYVHFVLHEFQFAVTELKMSVYIPSGVEIELAGWIFQLSNMGVVYQYLGGEFNGYIHAPDKRKPDTEAAWFRTSSLPLPNDLQTGEALYRPSSWNGLYV